MKCKEIMNILEAHSPVALAESWDNVGLLVGREEKEVQKVIVALDASDEVIKQAVKCKADMLITHHPLVFKARSSITDQDFIGNRIIQLIQNDISYYAMHTNFDVRGMADLSAKYLQLTDTRILMETTLHDNGKQEGIGRVGKLPEPMKLSKLAEYVKACFKLESVKVCGDYETIMTTAAVSTGSGKDMIEYARNAGAQVLITGDIDHHSAIDAKAQGLSIIDAGHYGTEIIFSDYMSQFLQNNCMDVQIIFGKEENPFKIY